MKAFAFLLGPAGIGLAGLYDSLISTTSIISGMGVSTSGVRQVAQATGSSDNRRTDQAILGLRWITILLASAGAVVLFLLRNVVSIRMFGNTDQAIPVAVLALGVFFMTVSNSQLSILSGLRQVHDLARVTVISAFVGTLVAVAIVLFARGRGLALAVAASFAVTMLSSWWFVRRAHRTPSWPSWSELQAESATLLRLGFAFMLVGLTMTATLMLTRIFILKHCGLTEAGYFQAGWGIAVFYIDFILNAMGVDFYPSLAARINDRPAANSLVNQQTEVSLLLGGPLLMAMISFAPFVIRLLYSPAFASSAKLLVWLALGSIFKLVAWPLQFIVMARGKGMVILLTEVLRAAVFLGALDLGARHYGFTAAGYAFTASYLSYALLMYVITRRSVGFEWTPSNLALVAVLLVACSLGIAVSGSVAGYVLGATMTLALSLFSLWRIWGPGHALTNQSEAPILQSTLLQKLGAAFIRQNKTLT